MRVLVCGGRDFTDHVFANWALVRYLPNISAIIHGGARGADTLGGLFAKMFGIPVDVYPANWEQFGKSAGYKRNALMLKEGKPDLVVAFPGGKGTAMMVSIAVKAGVVTHEYKDTYTGCIIYNESPIGEIRARVAPSGP